MTILARIPCRLAIVGLTAGILLLSVGALRPPEGQFRSGLSREKFWQVKLRSAAAYDVVLAGDSRVLCDLDPSSMSNLLPGRVLNFGFNLVALTPEYLDASVAKLDPYGLNRTVVIGVTPRSFTLVNARLSGYVEESRRPVDERFFDWYLNTPNMLFRPISIPFAIRELRTRQVGYKDFFPSGWMPVSLRPTDPDTDLPVYQRIFVGNRVSGDMEEAFLRKVREYSSAGIRVLALRLPVAPRILDAENGMSGFDEGGFVKRFESSGGKWLASPPGTFLITDGSHIDARDVPRYSALLAAAIRSAEQPR